MRGGDEQDWPSFSYVRSLRNAVGFRVQRAERIAEDL